MTEHTNTPELRFPEFRDKWSIYKLFEVLKSKTEGMKRGPFGGALKKELFVGDGYAVYEQRNAIYDNQDFRYFIDENKYKEMILFSVLPGDIIMSCSGTIGRLSLIPNNYREGVINQALIRFRTNNAVFNNYFLIYMRSMYMQRKMLEINPGSAITNLIPVKELKLLDFPLPSLDEQEKISDFFSKLDRQIELEEEKLELLEQQKRGYMQKIFSQELRFKDENNNNYPEWKIKKLEEISEFQNGKAHENFVSDTGKFILVNSKFISTESKVKKYVDKQLTPLRINDIAIVMSDVPNGKALAKCYLIENDNTFTLNQRIGRIFNIEGNSRFLFTQINRNKQLLKYDSGVGQTNLKKSEIIGIKIYWPNKREQDKIGDFFINLDSIIEKQSTKVELLKQRKKGLLQKMFV